MFGISIRRLLLQGQAVVLALTTAYMTYTALSLLTNCKSPILVVVSGSMEPGIHRGDLIFLTNHKPHQYRYATGDIVVYQFPDNANNNPTPIVHRVVQTVVPQQLCAAYYPNPDCPQQELLTKGDNNDVDDVGLYPEGLERIERAHVLGKVRFILPFVGYGSILLKNDDPLVRYVIFALVGLASLGRS
ncbi:signal peptidase complex catalytic subunit SEC11 [Mycena filopes]|nr:signal peptidase complex catalytic subunit SEC11 [Mycena filopes]